MASAIAAAEAGGPLPRLCEACERRNDDHLATHVCEECNTPLCDDAATLHRQHNSHTVRAIGCVRAEEGEVAEVFVRADEHAPSSSPAPTLLASLRARLTADFQLFAVWALHALVTLVIWQHFFLIKLREKQAAVPEQAHQAWMKRVFPALEFGAMHVVLFQLALLPLTMSHTTIRLLGSSPLRAIFPFHHLATMHVFLGYLVGVLTVAGFALFLVFFGMLCTDYKNGIEPNNFCNKLDSEIMITGYAILGLYLIVGVSSRLRHCIPYELFYCLHHLVFVLYFVTIAHTLDHDQTSGKKQRSQTFKWFTGSLVWYFTDRVYRFISRDTTRVVRAKAFSSPRSVLLEVERPRGFHFLAGQYVQLAIPQLSAFYHPFSIGNAPGEGTLVFHVLAKDQGSWTERLWTAVHNDPQAVRAVHLMGPFGACVQSWAMYDHVVCVGCSTGIVPLMSIFSKLCNDTRRVDSSWKAGESAPHVQALRSANSQLWRSSLKSLPPRKRSSAHSLTSLAPLAPHPSPSSPSSPSSSPPSSSSSVGSVLKWSVVVLALVLGEVVGMGLDVSWTLLRQEVTDHMLRFLRVLHVCSLVGFVGVVGWCSPFRPRRRRQPGHRQPKPAFVDVVDVTMTCVMCVVMGLTWQDFLHASWGQVAARLAVAAYRVLRLGSLNPLIVPAAALSVGDAHATARTGPLSIQLCWVVSDMEALRWFKDALSAQLADMERKFGREMASSLFGVRVFVAQPGVGEDEVRELLAGTPLQGKAVAGRVDFLASFQNMLMARTLDTTKRSSVTGVHFCGNATVGNELSRVVAQVNAEAKRSGNKRHLFTLTKEYYGILGPSRTAANAHGDEAQQCDSLLGRRSVVGGGAKVAKKGRAGKVDPDQEDALV